MGTEHNRSFPTDFLNDPVAERQKELDRKKRIMDRMAELEAFYELADTHCPSDIVDFGIRHNIPNFAQVVWNAGFMSGFRVAMARKKSEPPV